MDAVGERERLRQEREAIEAAWSAEWLAEQRADGGRPAKKLCTDEQQQQSELKRLWATCGIPE
eukprot:5550115-Pleurochrysis_carterae.AAC.4